jgi:hypothetical protein
MLNEMKNKQRPLFWIIPKRLSLDLSASGPHPSPPPRPLVTIVVVNEAQ